MHYRMVISDRGYSVEFADGSTAQSCKKQEHFGLKTEMISDLAITPTAAYLLAAPSAPFDARQAALDRAKFGETITPVVAKEILGAARKNYARNAKAAPADKLRQRLGNVLHRFEERWNPAGTSALLPNFAFADGLTKTTQDRKKGKAR